MGEGSFQKSELSSTGIKSEKFLLLMCDEYSFFVTRHHFQIMVNFFFAREHAKTWSDFWCIGGPILREYCKAFIAADEYRPNDNDLLADISDDVWILNDCEFPGVQCAEETTSRYGDLFPTQYRIGAIHTEYGHRIDLYSNENNEQLLDVTKSLGIELEKIRAPFPIVLEDYGQVTSRA